MRASSPAPPLRVLILGGTTEATALAHALAGRAGIETVLSYAGRTAAPLAQPVATRVGGFGGIDGLASYLRDEAIDILVDATHPFAAQISRHARQAAQQAPCRLIEVVRPPWRPVPGDDWTEVAGLAEAIAALGDDPRRVFLSVGRLQLAAFEAAPQHHYLVRTIDPVSEPTLEHATYIEARGPFVVEDEIRLLQDHRIEMLVTKNSGGTAAAPKLDAARRLGLPVLLLRRPAGGGAACTVEAALAAIDAHRAALRRGV